VTILNSGSWLALLSQASKLPNDGAGLPILFWGLGALLGTSIWLSIYLSTLLQWRHDLDRTDTKLIQKLDRNVNIGIALAVSSLFAFTAGVVSLACLFW